MGQGQKSISFNEKWMDFIHKILNDPENKEVLTKMNIESDADLLKVLAQHGVDPFIETIRILKEAAAEKKAKADSAKSKPHANP